MQICWYCFVEAHSFVRAFFFDFTWTVVIYGQKEDNTKMLKLLACFIYVTGKYYFHRGFEKLMDCKVPPSEVAS